MIRTLAQIILRQVGAPKGVRLDAPARPSPFHPATQGTTCVRRTRPRSPAPAPDRVAMEEGRWPEPQSQALLVLFKELAQRRVQAARARDADL